ncbi:hypothetical protein K461DRAFT_282834 [Myriangium duriaei CBS 260.36]|uniref:Uncharacterized protein n=1 Tax=Myriangium duriaei CBS 260.36 TaxID=1168546 RepID=A0A9P4IRJ2_9PEZI|nr:hypothetical protein K461DRAFT_282834 [Myriangium duriaei CBS 260.36]
MLVKISHALTMLTMPCHSHPHPRLHPHPATVSYYQSGPKTHAHHPNSDSPDPPIHS